MLRLAVFSDVHGNPYGLRAVLEEIEKLGPFDAVVAAGDLAFGGSDPALCIDMIVESGVTAVYGNTDAYIHSPENAPTDDQHRPKWDRILDDVRWVREKLGDTRIAWLADLPFDLRFAPTPRRSDHLYIVHANPLDVEGVLFPPVEDQIMLRGKVLQPDDDPELDRLLGSTEASVIAFGHLHFPSERRWKAVRLVNVASVSMPAVDKDPRARFSMFTWRDGTWEVERRAIEYDYTQELAALASSGMPHWREHAATFEIWAD